MSQMEEQKLGVRNIDLTRKSSLMLPQTRLIADNLHTKIMVDSKWAETEGKAYLISQEPLSNDYTKSTVLQETTDQQLVTMETVHPSNEDISKQFKREKRQKSDPEITKYPMYLAMFVLSILYSVLIYKTGIQKIPIIIESSQWLDIFLVSVIFIIAEGFIYYWISTQEIDKTIFKSYTLPRSKTFEIRHDGQVKSLSTTYFEGMFFTLETASSKKVFGYSPSELEEYMKLDRDITITTPDGKKDTRYVQGESYVKVINDTIANKLRYEKKIVDSYQVYQMKKYELDNIEAEFVSNVHQDSEDFVKETEIKEMKENDKNIQERKKELETIKENYDEVRNDYYPKWEIERDLVIELQEEYMKRLDDILGKAKDQKAREMLVNSEKHIMTLKHKVSIGISRVIRLTNLLQNAYDEGLIRSDEVMEHVYSIVQESGANKYEISYRIQDNNGSERVATTNNNNGHSTNGTYNHTSKSTYNLDLTPVARITAFVAGAVAIIYAMGWLIPTILGAFGGVTVLGVVAIFATMFLFLIIGWSIMRSVNLFSDSVNNRTTLGFK